MVRTFMINRFITMFPYGSFAIVNQEGDKLPIANKKLQFSP
jgi:hypothetical protein